MGCKEKEDGAERKERGSGVEKMVDVVKGRIDEE